MPDWLQNGLAGLGCGAGVALIVWLMVYSLVHNRWPWDGDDLD